MWVFKYKMKSNGYFERYKARLAGDGKSQIMGVDCDETFIYVVKLVTIFIVLTITLSRSWRIHQIDDHHTFLRGDLHEIVCMHQPLSFHDPHYLYYVCCLQKSLYSLKQASRA